MAARKTVVVIPTYNERENLGPLVEAVLSGQDQVGGFELNILVVDSNSSDGTADAIQEISQRDSRVHLLQVAERGLGLALMRGYDWAEKALGAQVIVQMDADFSHDPRHLPDMLEHIAQGYDLVVGSRYIDGGGVQDWPLSRRVLSWGANITVRVITGVWNIHEWTSGYRAFTVDLYQRLDRAAIGWRDYTLVPALVYEAICREARIREVPITFVNRRFGRSKLPAIRYALNLLRHFLTASLKQRLNRLRGVS